MRFASFLSGKETGKTHICAVFFSGCFFQATYKPSPEGYIRSIKHRFTSVEVLTLPNVKQICVLAYCQDFSTVYIAFRGSVDLDDWLVNLDTEMVELNDHLYEPEEDEEEEGEPAIGYVVCTLGNRHFTI